MATQHLSLRVDGRTLQRLNARSREAGQTRSHFVKQLIEEGLRMEAHPGIVFQPTLTGREPRLVGGPKVWHIASVYRGLGLTGEKAIAQTAKLTGYTVDQVRTAIRYYVDYPEELDGHIDANANEAQEQERLWRREQGLPPPQAA